MATVLPFVLLLCITAAVLYRLKLDSLSHVKGPAIAALSPLFLYVTSYLGVEARVIRYYHEKYKTNVLRVGPNSVSISDSTSIQDIYITNGGFMKDARYTNFNMGPVVSIFSAIDVEYRNRRAKAVAPLFSPARLRKASEPGGVISQCVHGFVDQLRSLKSRGFQADILDLSARCSIDVVTGYLLGEQYGGLREDSQVRIENGEDKKLSANPFIFAIVAFARFSLLPHWLFQYVYAISSWLNSSDQVTGSLKKLDEFAERVTTRAIASKKYPGDSNESTYQERLLGIGIEQSEVTRQAQATIFAGADSTAVMQATILFHLVQNPNARARLLSEIRTERLKPQPVAITDSNRATEHRTDETDSPYLRAVVKEGLRLGMANPTRLTRVVPARGLQVGTVVLPPGTIVGCAAYILHHDPAVFPEPFEFRPERWLEDSRQLHDGSSKRSEMARSLMPFGAGLRACVGKNLAQQQLHEAVRAVVDSEVLEGARTCQERIELTEWFNAEIKDHRLDIAWDLGG